MSSTFSFKKFVRFTVITSIAAIATAPYALADANGGTFDLTPFEAQQTALSAQAPAAAGYDEGGFEGVAATTGDQTSAPTGRLNYTPSPSRFTDTQSKVLNLAYTTRTILSQKGSQKLPKTTLDSFVYQAGGAAEQIYGDEGQEGLPPMFGMDESHTIGSGINSGGLTTGHQSNMPSAWCSYY
ncbi:MAG: hypothetical protein JST01_05140 [Cyanobacteria bacterium SZAS TMP-1]|nr:hypothetical protein [Cyanobacteria bacterium SZAS TMP-1]